MAPRSKREYLRELVAEKNRWFRPLTEEEESLGFLGWHERGYLPHCDYPGLVQFITFRLEDSMPASRRGEWEHLLKLKDPIVKRTKLEEYLDKGVGECGLRNHEVAKTVENALIHFHNQRYELLAWTVTPNHVHSLIHVWQTPLSSILQSWKSFTTTHTNKLLERSGRLWEPEYWDTFMRDEEQERKAIRYIESNPVKARLCQTAAEWPFGSARYRDLKTGGLHVPGAQSSSSARI
jgi:REP element-mobilizing transposase RayT